MPQPIPSIAKVLLAMPFALALAQPAAAVQDANFKFDTTADLVAVCATPASTPEYPVANQACRAFIEATVQYHDEISDRKHLKRLICYPTNATIDDGKAALASWALTHISDQKLMGEQPVVGLMRSLAAKYPCKK
jgi:hypothetical protein